MQAKKILQTIALAVSVIYLSNNNALASSISTFYQGGKAIISVEDLTITSPWSRQTPKSAKVAGGYMRVANESGEDEKLLGATSPICGHIEIHEMGVKNGVMKMRHLKDGLVIPAHKEIIFKPGSYHIMFMDLKKPFIRGNRFPVTLRFKNRGPVPVTFDIEAMGALAPTPHSMKR